MVISYGQLQAIRARHNDILAAALSGSVDKDGLSIVRIETFGTLMACRKQIFHVLKQDDPLILKRSSELTDPIEGARYLVWIVEDTLQLIRANSEADWLKNVKIPAMSHTVDVIGQKQ